MATPVQPLRITHARANGRRVLVVRGTVGLDTAPEMIAAFTRAARREEPLAIDLAEAGADGHDGMTLLVNSVRRLHRRRNDVAVVCPPGVVRTVLDQTALARRLTLVDDASGLWGPAVEPDPTTLAPAVVGGHRQRMSTPARRGALLAEATLALEARHPDPGLGIDDVARAIATSTRQLQRVFSELAGSAFRDELAAVRMQNGAVLLQTTALPVAEVARRVGYRQAAQFAKAFRREHGVSPSGLRRERPG
jgi:AraC family transcriptional regulator, regulatory protein of adaptative response / methylphosphotriester-DNA alkyltransferase methyltransferase